MFVAPPEKEIEWNDSGLEGSARFLARVWRLVMSSIEQLDLETSPSMEGALDQLSREEQVLRRKTHETIRRVSHDIDPRVHLNTVISALMELVNGMYVFRHQLDEAQVVRPERVAVLKEAIEALVLMLAPFTPHLSEELWEALGHNDGTVAAGWPSFDPAAAQAEQIVIPVQVNGRVRGRLTVSADISEQELQESALQDESVKAHTVGKEIKRVIVVVGKLVNVVAR